MTFGAKSTSGGEVASASDTAEQIAAEDESQAAATGCTGSAAAFDSVSTDAEWRGSDPLGSDRESILFKRPSGGVTFADVKKFAVHLRPVLGRRTGSSCIGRLVSVCARVESPAKLAKTDARRVLQFGSYSANFHIRFTPARVVRSKN